jgi:hypothetical protein
MACLVTTKVKKDRFSLFTRRWRVVGWMKKRVVRAGTKTSVDAIFTMSTNAKDPSQTLANREQGLFRTLVVSCTSDMHVANQKCICTT